MLSEMTGSLHYQSSTSHLEQTGKKRKEIASWRYFQWKLRIIVPAVLSVIERFSFFGVENNVK